MKSKDTIERRLRTLRMRYAKKFISASQERLHINCEYNIEHNQRNWWSDKTESEISKVDIAPHHSVTLLVIQPEQSPRLCMYGAEDPAHWPGSLCDSDEIAKSCKWFKPRCSAEQAEQNFLILLQDDKYVYDNFRDMASLQWVLEDRVYKHALSWWERFILWLKISRIRVREPSSQPPPADLPEGVWDDDDSAANS